MQVYSPVSSNAISLMFSMLAPSVMSYLLLLYIVWLLKSHSVLCLGSEDARQVNEMFTPLTTVWLLGPCMIVEGSVERGICIYL